jgi:hypothetical protein
MSAILTLLVMGLMSATDDGLRSAVLSTTRHRADDINCCTATDDGLRSAVLSTTRHRADDINCCTATDDGPRVIVLFAL